MTVNVFISQPMSGRSVEEIQEERDRIVHFIKKNYDFRFNCSRVYCMVFKHFNSESDENKINVVNPIEWKNVRDNTGQHLGRVIADLEKCDFVIFAKGWECSTACCIEMEEVRKYRIPYAMENDILSGSNYISIKRGEI